MFSELFNQQNKKAKRKTSPYESVKEEDKKKFAMYGCWVQVLRKMRFQDPVVLKEGSIYWAYNEEKPKGKEVVWNRDRLLTLVTEFTEHTVKLFDYEFSTISEEEIKKLVTSKAVEKIPFIDSFAPPIFKVATQEMIDALQIDGLTYNEAINYVMKRSNIAKKSVAYEKPEYYYTRVKPCD